MAAYQGDVSRYSESDGFLDDYHDRLLWPYRDWVIEAFNRNMPFNEFGTWRKSRVICSQPFSSAEKESRLSRPPSCAWANERRRTVRLTKSIVSNMPSIGPTRSARHFLGMTVGCALLRPQMRPDQQKDFYSLSGFFNSTDEPGFYAPGRTGITSGPTLPWTDRRLTRIAAAEARGRKRRRSTPMPLRLRGATRGCEAATLASAPTDAAAVVRQSLLKALVEHYPFEAIEPVPDDKLPRSEGGQSAPCAAAAGA